MTLRTVIRYLHCMLSSRPTTPLHSLKSANRPGSRNSVCALLLSTHWSTSYCKVSDKTDNLLYSSRCLTFISSMAFVANTVAAIDNKKLKKMKAAAEGPHGQKTMDVLLATFHPRSLAALAIPAAALSKDVNLDVSPAYLHIHAHCVGYLFTLHCQTLHVSRTFLR